MEEQINQSGKKNGLSKRVIVLVSIILLIVAGSAAAYIAFNSSAKNKYFAAEKATIDFASEELQNRFEPEVKWQEYAQKNAIASTFELSGEYNDPNSEEGFGLFSPDQLINSSSLTLKTEQDIDNKRMSAELIANIAGMEIDNVNAYLTDQEFMLGLPFLDDILLVKNKDVNRLLKEIDPELDALDIDFADLFDTKEQIFSEKDVKYFEKEYLKMIHDELSEDSFTTKDEKIEVEGQSLKTEQIKMQLSEQEVKDLLTKIIDKLHKDKRVKEIIKDQLGATVIVDQDMQEVITEYEDSLLELKEEVKQLHIPDGITSTIWINKNLVVKREFSISAGSSADDLASLTIGGEQLLENKNQTFTYDFNFKDSYDQGTLTLEGDLTWKDDTINDSIKIIVDEAEISYTAKETVKNGKRDFNRTFSFSDPYDSGGSLVWSGKADYKKDSMSSEHSLAIEIDELGSEFLTVNLGIDGKKIKAVDIPKGENIKDIGQMSETELNQYIEEDAAMQFQQWVMQFLGGGLGF